MEVRKLSKMERLLMGKKYEVKTHNEIRFFKNKTAVERFKKSKAGGF